MRTRRLNNQSPDRPDVTPGGENVFADLGFAPKEVAELKTKADLTLKIYRQIKALGLTQVRAARRLGISQPDVSKLASGRFTGFSIDRLLSLLNALEVDVDIIVRPKPRGRSMRPGVVRVLETAKG